MNDYANIEPRIDLDLATEILEAVRAAQQPIDGPTASTSSTDTTKSIDRLVKIHVALRTLVGADPDVDVTELPDTAGDLSDLITYLLRSYTAALAKLAALAAEPVDPAVEYERLLHAAEKEVTGIGIRNDGAARGEALAKIADRWLSDALVEAHRRRTRTDGEVTHFGSPAPSTVVRSLDNRLADVDAVTRYLEARPVEVLVVVDAKGALYLVSDNEDAPFYIGIPQAEDEDGTTVDPNRGRLDRTPDGRGLPVFPLVVLGVGHGASYPQP